MTVANVLVTDEATPRYNCLAWTLGISTSWIWPWAQRNPTKAEFDTLYQGCGFASSNSGPIAAFGLSLNEMTHGAISGPGHGPRWESKCGAWLRIQHGLSEMEGGTLYGNVLGFYVQADNPALESRSMTLKAMSLSRKERKFLQERAAQVDAQLKERFEHTYQHWKDARTHPLITISSDPGARTHTPEFLELISLGSSILPLVMEKLADPDEFFALQIADRLIRPEFVVSWAVDDPRVLLGEQRRAVETVKQWIHREA